jgi:hypothetical protein
MTFQRLSDIGVGIVLGSGFALLSKQGPAPIEYMAWAVGFGFALMSLSLPLQVVFWGVPLCVFLFYFGDLHGVRELWLLAAAGVLRVVLHLWEQHGRGVSTFEATRALVRRPGTS